MFHVSCRSYSESLSQSVICVPSNSPIWKPRLDLVAASSTSITMFLCVFSVSPILIIQFIVVKRAVAVSEPSWLYCSNSSQVVVIFLCLFDLVSRPIRSSSSEFVSVR